jgi:hypothetical protein
MRLLWKHLIFEAREGKAGNWMIDYPGLSEGGEARSVLG